MQKGELAAALERQEADSLAYWNAFPTDFFFARIGSSWSPAETVRHLSKSTRAVVNVAADERPFVAPALKRLRQRNLHGVTAAADRVVRKWRQPPCRSAVGSLWPLAAERVVR
jgi:hypothetical protein